MFSQQPEKHQYVPVDDQETAPDRQLAAQGRSRSRSQNIILLLSAGLLLSFATNVFLALQPTIVTDSREILWCKCARRQQHLT